MCSAAFKLGDRDARLSAAGSAVTVSLVAELAELVVQCDHVEVQDVNSSRKWVCASLARTRCSAATARGRAELVRSLGQRHVRAALRSPWR
jgi:hypothetical protein